MRDHNFGSTSPRRARKTVPSISPQLRLRKSSHSTGTNGGSLGGSSHHSNGDRRTEQLFASKRQNQSIKNLLDDTNFFKLDSMLQSQANTINSQVDKDGKTPLVQALQAKDSVKARLLLEHGADPDLAIHNGETPLYIAACNGNVEEVALLLTQGADPDKATRAGETPLYGAAYYGHEYCVDLLLENEADPNKPNKINAETPLYGAAIRGHALCVDVLMERGADIYATTNQGLTPLYGAAKQTKGNFIETLLEEAGSVGGYGKSTRNLSSASNSGYEACVKLLLEKDEIIEKEMEAGQTPLVWACKTGLRAWVELFLDKGADPNHMGRSGDTPLFQASLNGHEEICYILLERKANPNKVTGDGETPLFAAARNGHESCLELLLEYKADPNRGSRDGMDPISFGGGGGGSGSDSDEEGAPRWSASAKSRSLLQINEDAEMDPRERKYNSMKDARKAMSMMSVVTEKSDNLGGSGRKSRWTSNSFRSKRNRKSNSDLSASPILAASREKQTPLYNAALYGHEGCVEILVAKCADPNLGDRDTGETPLLAAVKNGHVDCVEALIMAGADCDLAAKNITPKKKDDLTASPLELVMTPLKMAIELGDEEIALLILERGKVNDLKFFDNERFTKSLIQNAKPSFVVFLLSSEHMKWEAKQNIMEQCLRHVKNDDRLLLIFLHAGLEDLSRRSIEHDTVFLLMIDFWAYCWWIGTFAYSTFFYALVPDAEPTLAAFYIMLIITGYFFLREVLELRRSSNRYFLDFWNWVDLTTIALCTTTGTLYLLGHDLVSEEDSLVQLRYRYVVMSAGCFICLSFVGYLKSTFLPFSNFVGGVVRILFDLFPLAIVTTIVLAAFSFMFYIQNFQQEGYEDFVASFYTVFTSFVGEFDNASNPLDIIFGILSTLILLNVVIAIVSTSWESAVSTSLILLCGHRLELLRQVDAFVPTHHFTKRQWISNGYDEDYNRFVDKNILAPTLKSWNGGMKAETMHSWNPRVIIWSAGRFILTVPFRITLLAFPWFLGLNTFGLLWPKHIREKLFGIVPDKKDPKTIRQKRSLLLDEGNSGSKAETKDMVDEMKGLREELKKAASIESLRGGFRGGFFEEDHEQTALLESLEHRIGRMENQMKNMNNDILQRYNKIEGLLGQIMEAQKPPTPTKAPPPPPSRAPSRTSSSGAAKARKPPPRTSSNVSAASKTGRLGRSSKDGSISPIPNKPSSIRSRDSNEGVPRQLGIPAPLKSPSRAQSR